MRFLVDECTGPAVAAWLRDQGHEVCSVFEEIRGSDDETIILKALQENRILITNDKDFGDKVYRDGRLHRGVILLRLTDERSDSKINALSRVLQTYSNRVPKFDSQDDSDKGFAPKYAAVLACRFAVELVSPM